MAHDQKLSNGGKVKLFHYVAVSDGRLYTGNVLGKVADTVLDGKAGGSGNYQAKNPKGVQGDNMILRVDELTETR